MVEAESSYDVSIQFEYANLPANIGTLLLLMCVWVWVCGDSMITITHSSELTSDHYSANMRVSNTSTHGARYIKYTLRLFYHIWQFCFVF